MLKKYIIEVLKDVDLSSKYYPKAKELKAAGKSTSSLLYKYDLSFNPMRIVCVLEVLRRQHKKFKVYYPR